MTEIFHLLIQSLMFAILVSGLVGWWRVIRFWRRGTSIVGEQAANSPKTSSTLSILERLLPAVSQKRPFWTPAEFLLAFGLHLVLLIGLSSLFIQDSTQSTNAQSDSVSQSQAAQNQPDDPQIDPVNELKSESSSDPITSLLIQLAATSLAILAMLGWLTLFQRDAFRRVGFTLQLEHFKIALLSTPLILSVVMLLSLLASAFIQYEHPVLTSLFENKSALFCLLTFLVTAIATPVYEEFLFRGLLQGSLQAIANPVLMDETWSPTASWPVFVTSLLFAAMHSGQGAAPIPIFALSVGLGYLYRQTGSLSAPILVHVILNSITLLDAFTTP